jgi:hypothetical protein
MNKWELAQVNIARLIEPLESDRLEDFVANLDPVNSDADKAPGFIWRLQTEGGDATSIQAFEWDVHDTAGVIVNLSKWESIDALKDFMYSGQHVEMMKRRFEWFHKVAEATTALWWVPAGHIPTTEEAEQKVQVLREYGPTPEAFTFRTTFTPTGESL